jgi:threonine/homoserine/homoserine lactone efflux protein
MPNITILVSAVGLGIAYCAAPGAVNTEAIRRGTAQGAHSTLLVETGSLIGDSFWALLALTGITVFTRQLAIQIILGIAGGCFLLRMAWLALYEALRRHTPEATPSTTRGDFTTGVIFGLANPFGLAFWSGLGSSVIASGNTGLEFVLFFAGFFLGAVLWCIIIAAIIRWGRRWVHPSLFRWINALCGLALGYFGVRVLWITLQDWLEHQIIPALKPTR